MIIPDGADHLSGDHAILGFDPIWFGRHHRDDGGIGPLFHPPGRDERPLSSRRRGQGRGPFATIFRGRDSVRGRRNLVRLVIADCISVAGDPGCRNTWPGKQADDAAAFEPNMSLHHHRPISASVTSAGDIGPWACRRIIPIYRGPHYKYHSTKQPIF